MTYRSFTNELMLIKEAISAKQYKGLEELFKSKPKVKPWLGNIASKGGFKFEHPSVTKFRQSLKLQAGANA